MPISFIHPGNALLRNLGAFTAGYGQQSIQNKAIEQQQKAAQRQEIFKALTAAGSSIADAIGDRAARADRFALEDRRQEHILDRDMLRQTGLTYDEMRTFADQAGLSVPEAISEMRARRLKREAEAEQDAFMQKNGYMKGWSQDKIESRLSLNRELGQIIDSDLSGPEKLQAMNEVSREMSEIKPGWIPDPEFPRIPQQEEFDAAQLTDSHGNLYTKTIRNGAPDYKMQFNKVEFDQNAKAVALKAQQVLWIEAMKASKSLEGEFDRDKARQFYNDSAKVFGLTPLDSAEGEVGDGSESLQLLDQQFDRQIQPMVMGGDRGAVQISLVALSTMPPDRAKEAANRFLAQLQKQYGGIENVPDEIVMQLDPLLRKINLLMSE